MLNTKKISIYTADTFGFCSALYELGGLIIIHDASGCNSTYTTHDEPRWGLIDSNIYISALTEVDSISGNDNKIINDIIDTAKLVKPKFIAICGTPIPSMTGFDYLAVAKIIEDRINIKTFGVNTTGMEDYVIGIIKAYDLIFDNLINEEVESPKNKIENSINLIGLTPLDFYYNNEDMIIKKFFFDKKIEVISSFTVDCDIESLKKFKSAEKNIALSESGIKFAERIREKYNISYDVGIPILDKFYSVKDILEDKLNVGVKYEYGDVDSDLIIIGEKIKSLSLYKFLKENTKFKVKVLYRYTEDELVEIIKNKKFVIADGLFEPICNSVDKFINYPHVAFSGRLYDDSIKNINDIAREVLEYEKNNS